MDVTDARVRKCTNVTTLMDKKMRERRIKHIKYIIMLDENTSINGMKKLKLYSRMTLKIGNMLKSQKRKTAAKKGN